tara:strand:+ start:611 stop:6343 length:5733 start_codon:yes stop_codon:yes gene_type:complete
MPNTQRNFVRGRMNKSLDERLVPNGEYIDALNVRLGSTEASEIGAVENSKGNTQLTTLQYEETGSDEATTFLSADAKCIGTFEDGQNNRIYWFVHDPNFSKGLTKKLDLIVSLNPTTNNLNYHVVSIDDGTGVNTTLNFNSTNLITSVNKIEDLLFFTDNVNPPRVINVQTNYPNPEFNQDLITAEELLVIKKPPTASPQLSFKFKTNPLGDDFLSDRFICFAYRYQYANGEFSATSQWTQPAFDPGIYDYNFSTNTNEGMINTISGVDIVFNSGSPLVKAIQLLYKENVSNVIKIIDKLDKNLLGYADNTDYSFAFNNSKIFTVLPESELLRLYDNVPLRAVAQTIMGNRLVYGNYYEGYDLKDLYNNPVQQQYTAQLVETEITNINLETSTIAGTYTYGASKTIANSVLQVELGALNQFTQLIAGVSLNFTFVFEHSEYDPTASQPTTTTQNVELQFSYTLPRDYTSVFDLVADSEFQEAIGTSGNIKPVYDAAGANSCTGFTLTDNFNCLVPTTQTTSTGTVTKYASGITSSTTAAGEPIAIVGNVPASTAIKLQLPAMRYVTDPASPTGGFYEYYKIVSSEATYSSVSTPKSLHSNRGYEVGIVYMDEFLRSSTALTSTNNTVYIPCRNSRQQNEIQVTIPWGQRAPFWAKFYKFCIKPDKGTYETIYAETYFKDPNSNSVYFLLEGENAAKVESGQRLVVKRDSGGAVEQCVVATVIEKASQEANFLQIENPFNTGTDPTAEGYYLPIPSGAYAEIVPSGFNISVDQSVGQNFVAYPAVRTTFPANNTTRGYPVGRARVNILNPNPDFATVTPTEYKYKDYTIPVNSKINIRIFQNREGGNRKNGKGCEFRRNLYESPDLFASQNYNDFKDWFDGDNIANKIISNSVPEVGGGGTVNNVYNNTILTGAATEPEEQIRRSNQNPYINVAVDTNYYQFYRSDPSLGGDNSFWFLATGTLSCKSALGIGGQSSNVEIEITVERANQAGVVVFETEPSDAAPDIWFENELSFPINDNGEHQGNLQNQNIQTQTPAIIETNFFDCFSFGNGVESYRVRDSIKGEQFTYGNRVTTTAGQDYKEVHRFADLTYSGVFNDETNVNKLNEFNLGLLNFKNLEEAFASVQKLFARETDILVLQEDRISYVLAGKDLLSDAGGGGALTSVPQVLGQQIARLEEYGISRNPESFAVFGPDKFFTDEQRGAVLQLKGGAYNNESLTVISEFGMRPYFRDLFHSTYDQQKIGGFDPYMNEYVLSSNGNKLPFVGDCDFCGTSRDIQLQPNVSFTYCVNVTQEVGTVNIDYVLPSGGNNNIVTEDGTGTSNEILTTETNSTASSGGNIVTEDATSNNNYTITALYNGNSFTTGPVSISGTLQIDKNSVYADIIAITVSSDAITTDAIEITTFCPEPDQITIFQVSITSNQDRGKFIHNEYRWTDGLFISPLHSELVEFASGTQYPLLSQFTELTGSQGAGVIPDDGAEITIISNKLDFDDFEFDASKNNFRYLRTSTFYGKTLTDLSALLAASATATPISTRFDPQFSAQFNMPAGTSADKNLYLIWDYRKSTQVQLCYSNIDATDACCTCAVEPTPTSTLTPTPTPTICHQYTLEVPAACESVSVKATATNTSSVNFTKCAGGAGFNYILQPNEEVEVYAQTGTVTATNGATLTVVGQNGGDVGTFWWLGCDGTPTQETVHPGTANAITRCAINVPQQPVGQGGTITQTGLCTVFFYRAQVCNSASTVFLQGQTTLGQFSIGDVVQFTPINQDLINTGQPTETNCATIDRVGVGNGQDGVINLQASACGDTTNCPQTIPVYKWVFSSNSPGAGSATPIPCTDSTFCATFVYTTASSLSTTFPGVTRFYLDINLNVPFQGQNNYFGVAAPAAGQTQANPQFKQGVLRMDDSGFSTELQIC